MASHRVGGRTAGAFRRTRETAAPLAALPLGRTFLNQQAGGSQT